LSIRAKEGWLAIRLRPTDSDREVEGHLRWGHGRGRLKAIGTALESERDAREWIFDDDPEGKVV
jgi:hypothetical protein